MNNATNETPIAKVAQRRDTRLQNNMAKAWKLAEKPYCVDFRVFDG